MSPRPKRTAADPVADTADDATPDAPAVAPPGGPGPASALADLPVAGLTRRRIGLLLGALVAAWIVVLFARQVSEASEATARAEAMRAANASMTREVAALEQELELIQRQEYIEQQARTYRLGPAKELPFVLSDDAPPLAADAPGQAAVRLGATTDRRTPLEAWLGVLFGDAAGGAPAEAAAPDAADDPAEAGTTP